MDAEALGLTSQPINIKPRNIQSLRRFGRIEGVPEIPAVVFEALLVNALVHRDYLYRGLGTGALRTLDAWPQITFRDDRDGLLFVATVRRAAVPAVDSTGRAGRGSEKSSEKILAWLATHPQASARDLAAAPSPTAPSRKSSPP